MLWLWYEYEIEKERQREAEREKLRFGKRQRRKKITKFHLFIQRFDILTMSAQKKRAIDDVGDTLHCSRFCERFCVCVRNINAAVPLQ